MRRTLIVLALLVAACGDAETAITAPTAIDVSYGIYNGHPYFRIFDDGGNLAITLNNLWVPDIEPRDDGQRGEFRWVDGSRNAYHTAYWAGEHTDPPMHGPTRVLRVSISLVGDPGVKLVDKYMSQFLGTTPYPYEHGLEVVAFHTLYPATKVGLLHHRAYGMQLLAEFDFADITGQAQWFYQGGGEFIGLVGGTPYFRMQFAGLHDGHDDSTQPEERYLFCVSGIAAALCQSYY